MKAYFVFTKKEWIESVRTYKLLILGAVFLLFGMMNPLTAKITPWLMSEFMPEGMSIALPEPSAMDSWMQFFKNVPQLGLIVLVIVFSGLLAGELSKGTLINMLTKGLSRTAVVLSKFTMACLLWTGSLTLCFGVSYAYTAYFWQGQEVQNLLFSVFCLWAFGVLLLAAVVLGGVLFQSSYGSLLFSGFLAVVLFLANMLPPAQKYNPVKLISVNMALLTGEITPADCGAALAVTVAVVAALLAAAIIIFRKKKI